MPKKQTTDYKILSIFWLKQQGFLGGGVQTGGIRWMRGQYERGSAKLAGVLWEPFSFVRLSYVIPNSTGDAAREYIHKISLTSTSCFFGGQRYWFSCPGCDSRCAILYLREGSLECRVCRDLAYESQQSWWQGWYSVLTRTIGRAREAEEELETLRVKTWKGEPTKRVRRLIRALDLIP